MYGSFRRHGLGKCVTQTLFDFLDGCVTEINYADSFVFWPKKVGYFQPAGFLSSYKQNGKSSRPYCIGYQNYRKYIESFFKVLLLTSYIKSKNQNYTHKSFRANGFIILDLKKV